MNQIFSFLMNIPFLLLLQGLIYAFQIIFDCNRSLASRILAECHHPIDDEEDTDSDRQEHD